MNESPVPPFSEEELLEAYINDPGPDSPVLVCARSRELELGRSLILESMEERAEFEPEGVGIRGGAVGWVGRAKGRAGEKV